MKWAVRLLWRPYRHSICIARERTSSHSWLSQVCLQYLQGHSSRVLSEIRLQSQWASASYICSSPDTEPWHIWHTRCNKCEMSSKTSVEAVPALHLHCSWVNTLSRNSNQTKYNTRQLIIKAHVHVTIHGRTYMRKDHPHGQAQAEFTRSVYNKG